MKGRRLSLFDVTAKSEPHENKAEELVLFLERYYQSGLSETGNNEKQ